MYQALQQQTQFISTAEQSLLVPTLSRQVPLIPTEHRTEQQCRIFITQSHNFTLILLQLPNKP